MSPSGPRCCFSSIRCQTETVTYISGRASGLMAFFYLFAFFLYIKASEHQDARNVRRLYLSGAIMSFLLSLGSKETAVTFPLALLLWDVLIRRLRGTLRSATLLSAPSAILARPVLAARMGMEPSSLFRARPVQLDRPPSLGSMC